MPFEPGGEGSAGHDDGGLLALMAAQRVQSSMNSFNVSISFCFHMLSR